jgi:hypothetical protein
MNKFAFTICLYFIFSSSQAYAQYNDPRVMSGIASNISGVIGYAPMSATPYGSMRLGDAAAIQAQGNFLVSQSEANINNQTAESMYYDNRLKKTRTYFENRQINSYSRDIEEWQKNTRRQLRGAGMYDREAIEYIYGIRR